MNIYIVKLFAENSRGRLAHVLDEALEQAGIEASDTVVLNSAERFRWIAETGLLKNGRIFFAVELDESGVNIEACRLLQYLNICGDVLAGSASGVIVDGAANCTLRIWAESWFLKQTVQDVLFRGNPLLRLQAVCRILMCWPGTGKPLGLVRIKKAAVFS